MAVNQALNNVNNTAKPGLSVGNRTLVDGEEQDESNSNRTQIDGIVKCSQKPGQGELSRQWKIVLLFASIYLGLVSSGFGNSLSVLYAELVRVLGVNRASVAMIQSFHLGFAFGSTILWNYPFRLYGPGRCILFSSLIFSVSICVGAFSSNIELLICFIGVVAGVSASVFNLGPYLIMGKVFKKERNAVFSLLACGSSIGQIVLTYGLEKLIDEYGWNGALLITSGLALNMVPCCLLIHLKTSSVNSIDADIEDNKLFKPRLFKNWRFVLLLINSFVFSVSVLPEGRFLVDLTVIKGFDMATGSLFTSLIGLTSLIGRCIGTGINAIDSGRSTLYLGFFILIAAVAHVVILLHGDYNGLLIGALLSGLSLGLCVSQFVVITLDVFPLQHYAAATVMWNIFGGLGNMFGGYIGGIIPDLTGSYDLIFEISTASCVFNCLCMVVMYLSLVIVRRRNGYERL